MLRLIDIIDNKRKTCKNCQQKKLHFHLNHLVLVLKKRKISYIILGDFMYNLVKRYMDNLTKEQVNDFALKNQVYLSEEELSFTYTFVKKNWEMIFRNPNLLQLERYKEHFSEENFKKIQKLFVLYYQKYGHLL